MTSRPPYLLLIDDSPVVVDVISTSLGDWGMSCRAASSGNEGLALFAEDEFDAVLLDVGLPDVGGLQVLTRLRGISTDVPVIMLTSYGEIDCVLTAIMHGAFDYVSKEEEIEVPLKAAIDRALAHVRLLRQNKDLISRLMSGEAEEDAIEALKRAQEELVQSERMAAVNVLTANVAHEINNPLAFITPSMEVLGAFCERASAAANASANAEACLMLNQCREGLQRIRRVVHSLSVFSRPSDDVIEAVDLEVLIGRTLLLLRERFDPNQVRTRFAVKEIGPVAGNHEHLQKVLAHLTHNAAEAVLGRSGGGEIGITTQKRGHRVEICVSDDGRGIPQANLPKVFEPFFTTKQPGEGTGLGLSVSRSLVEVMGGTIEIESVVDHGTTVRISLPLYHDAMAAKLI